MTVVVTVGWNVTWQRSALPGPFQTQSQLDLPVQQVQGPPVPADGAYLGAWPHPADYTIPSYIQAADQMCRVQRSITGLEPAVA